MGAVDLTTTDDWLTLAAVTSAQQIQRYVDRRKKRNLEWEFSMNLTMLTYGIGGDL